MSQKVSLTFPFKGWWLARNSPAKSIPSHGTHLLGTTYAIDFIGVNRHGRTAPWGLASLFSVESNEKFPGFGRLLLAPVSGKVVEAWDHLPDHEARRSQLQLAPYVLGQASRYRRGGVKAIAGNTVVIRCDKSGRYVTLCHLKKGSLKVRKGQRVHLLQPIASCGNSGNSTQPHVHIQVTNSTDWENCHGIEMEFKRNDREKPWMPKENQTFYV